jgi:hypothetical protein
VFLGYSNSHKGFKCLDPTEGRIYISRDVVFDERVYPFASLRPNAGARLRAELKLLLDILLNPSSNFGDALLHDKHLVSLGSTDAVHSSCEAGVSTSVDPALTAKNPKKNGAETTLAAPYFMCLLRGMGAVLDPKWICLTA